MASRFIRTEHHDAVVHVILDRPDQHNALLPEMWLQMRQIGEELTADRSVKCVVVRGTGESFCSGIDRRALADGVLTPFGFTGDPDDRERTVFQESDLIAAQACLRWLIDGAFVSIAAVRGFALGAGAQLAMACDLRVVGADAQFALPEVTIGLFPELSAAAVLPRIVGYDRALELALTGRRIDAVEAASLGLATHLVDADQVEVTAEELAVTIAQARADAIRFCKRAMRLGAGGEIDAAMAAAREGGMRVLQDVQEFWRRGGEEPDGSAV